MSNECTVPDRAAPYRKRLYQCQFPHFARLPIESDDKCLQFVSVANIYTQYRFSCYDCEVDDCLSRFMLGRLRNRSMPIIVTT